MSILRMLGLVAFWAWAAVAAADVPEAWRNVMDAGAATNAAARYAAGEVPVVWAGDAKNVAAAMPANAAFQFAVAGSETNVVNVRRILDATAAAMPDELRHQLARAQLQGPTLQWIVRGMRPGVTSAAEYLKAKSHPAAFRENDFNLEGLTNVAARLTAGSIPPAVRLVVSDEEYKKRPTAPAEAGVDYPGFCPEVTYSTPFGVGMVLHAPEAVRRLRFRAVAWPNLKLRVKFAWVVLRGSAWVDRWWMMGPDGRLAKTTPENGYATIRIDRRRMWAGSRTDVAVFAKVEGGAWGAPSIISFYASPYESRKYLRNGRLELIAYLPKVKSPPPYDVSAICLPANWTDCYDYDQEGRMHGFSRLVPGSVRMEDFSNLGELILEKHAGDEPKLTAKVRYFEKDGQLKYAETGERKSYKPNAFAPRLRGE